MEQDDRRLSRIQTLWTLVQKAHQGERPMQKDAQEVLLERYSGAIYRYLLGALRNEHAADEVFQEFALRFLEGKFKHAQREKGRFRDYVKTVLFHLVAWFHKKEKKEPFQGDAQVMGNVPGSACTEEADREFSQNWRDELLARTWEGLAEAEKKGGTQYYTMLLWRTQNPAVGSEGMAEEFTRQLGNKITPAGVRQTIHRAREKFAELLVEEVSRSLQTQDVDQLEQEIIDLGLHSYCSDALDKMRRRDSSNFA